MSRRLVFTQNPYGHTVNVSMDPLGFRDQSRRTTEVPLIHVRQTTYKEESCSTLGSPPLRTCHGRTKKGGGGGSKIFLLSFLMSNHKL